MADTEMRALFNESGMTVRELVQATNSSDSAISRILSEKRRDIFGVRAVLLTALQRRQLVIGLLSRIARLRGIEQAEQADLVAEVSHFDAAQIAVLAHRSIESLRASLVAACMTDDGLVGEGAGLTKEQCAACLAEGSGSLHGYRGNRWHTTHVDRSTGGRA